MTRLDLFKKMMQKAKDNGYTGSDYKYNVGYILDGTNIYSLIFREDFSKALWGSWGPGEAALPRWAYMTKELSLAPDKWEFLEKNLKLD